jgi:hypothetical protein
MYGAPGNGPGPKQVSADKGKRSFASGARKRPV